MKMYNNIKMFLLYVLSVLYMPIFIVLLITFALSAGLFVLSYESIYNREDIFGKVLDFLANPFDIFDPIRG